MFDDTPCGWLVQLDVLSLGITELGALDFLEVLLDSGQFSKNWVVFCIDTVQSEKGCQSKLKKLENCPRGTDRTE